MRQKNPLFIVLACCGGFALLAIIAVVISGVFVANKSKDLFKNMMVQMETMPKFIGDLQAHSYTSAEVMVDPSVSTSLNAAKLQKLEEAAEKKLGPLSTFNQKPDNTQPEQTSVQPKPGDTMPGMTYGYTFTLHYKKGTARAHFEFKSNSVLKPNPMITAFTLEPNSPE